MKKYVWGVRPYEGWKVYGPYTRKDNRQHVVLINPMNADRKTVHYSKFLVEMREGRRLSIDETVDHNDRDFTNNALDNLIIRARSIHASLDALRRIPETFTCDICNKEFTLEGRKLHGATTNRKRGHAGPYCGKSCAGKATHLKERIIKEVPIGYYYVNKRAW